MKESEAVILKPITFAQLTGMNLHYQRYSFDYFLDSMNRLGLTNIEFWAGAPHFYNYHGEKNTRRIQEIKRKVADHGLTIVCVTPEQCEYPANIAASDKELREYSVAYFSRYLEQTAELGATRFLTSAGWGNYDESREDAWNRGIESFGRLLRVAEREGIEIAFEILLPYESNLVNNLETTRKFMDTFDSPSLKCTIDTVPVCYEGRSMEDYFQVLGDRISHIHLNDGRPDGHLTWGDGEQPLEEHLLTLSQHDYSNYITLELGSSDYFGEPEASLRRGLDVLARYLPYSAK